MDRVSQAESHLGSRPGKIFYGWWIILGGAVGTALGASLNFYGFSAFFVSLTREFGWSRSALSGVFSLSQLEGGILGPVEGYLTDKFGTRKMMLVGIPLMAVGFILLSRINSLLSLYLVYIPFIALGAGLGFFTPVSAAVANWFNKRRSMAFGILMSGVAVGGAVILPVLGWWISNFGWRHAAVAAGVLILAVGLPVAFVVRHRPEDYGYLPDGARPASKQDTPTVEDTAHEPSALATEQAEFRAMQSLKTQAFWLLGLSIALRSVVTSGLTLHFVAMMMDRGFSMPVASGFLGAVAFLSLGGRIGLAWLGDIVDKRYVLAASMGFMALAMLGISQAQSLSVVVALLFFYAIFYGGSVVLPMSLQADYFGRRAFATIRGMVHTVQTVGMVVGPVFAGLVYDNTGSYLLAFLGFAAAGFLAALLLVGIRRPSTRLAAPLGVRRA